MSVQIRMRAGAVENNPALFLINAVYEEPIWFNMTFPFSLIFTMKRMVLVPWKQRLFIYKKCHYFSEFINILDTFLHQFAVFLKGTGICVIQHCLFVQIYQHFLKRIVPFCWYFIPKHSIPFLNGGNSLGIKKWFARFRVAVFGADGTFIRAIDCRGKGEYHPAHRYLWRNLKGNPAAGRNFNGLCNGHTVNVA